MNMQAKQAGKTKTRLSGNHKQTRTKTTAKTVKAGPRAAPSQGNGRGEEPAATLPPDNIPPPLDRAPLAYENPAFLNSADGRLIRILAEYTEPLARFRREHIQ